MAKLILITLLIIFPVVSAAQDSLKQIRVPVHITPEQYGPLSANIDENIRKAEQGDAEKQYILGMMYLSGHNVPKDAAKALKFIDMAAHNSYTPAQLNLAAFYFAGALVEHDEKKAMDIINQIDAKNDPKLWLELSNHFESGDINKKDQKMANDFLTKSANAGNIEAIKKLSYMYRTGTNIQKNPDEVIALYQKMYEIPEEKIKREAALLMIGLYSSPSEGLSSNEKVIEWLKKMANDLNDVTSQLRLGYIYRDGKEAPQDYKESMSWFEKAAKNGNAEAQTNIGYFYANGLGVKKDYAKAKEYYYNAALAGNAEGAYYLAQAYSEGYGVEKNMQEAYKWKELYNRLKIKK